VWYNGPTIPLPSAPPLSTRPSLAPAFWSRLRQWLGLAAESALVARVIDGDSIRLNDGREVRYLGIDAPELGGPEAAWAEKAKAANARLVEGRRVRLETAAGEADQDVYGRLLRHVFAGGTWVNGRLVEMGLARLDAYGPPHGRERDLARLQERAKRRGRGLWAKQRPWWRFW